jgi:hypothetical protein
VLGSNLFGPLQPHNEEGEVAVRECLPLQRSDLYRDVIFALSS